MNLFRIVQKRTSKRQDNGSLYRDAVYVLLFVFLLPYVISCLWGHIGEESVLLFQKEEIEEQWTDTRYFVTISGEWGSKELSMQDYLVRKLEMTMPEQEDSGIFYETEALKAQAVLLRTELWGLFLTNDGSVLIEDDMGISHESAMPEEEETVYREAVRETDALFLSYEGKPAKAAYFPISNGLTREAAEVLGNSNYPYLRQVECKQDVLAKAYQSQVIFSKKEFCGIAQDLFSEEGESLWGNLELTYDSSDYVTEVKGNDQSCNGETFRHILGLASASFQVDWQEDSVTFYVKGVGHGFGMSQYGANEKAISGERFDEILEDYFFQAELVKIE